VNERAGAATVVSADFARLLHRAQVLGAGTDGAFDVAVER
jgi:thiamine biosynthesis lipoprotein ApbE